MDSNVHPVVAFLVIILVIAAISVWTWGSGKAKEIGGPAELLTDPSGHLYVQVQNLLLEHDASGYFVAKHDLTKLGVERVLGAPAFFSNGDLLIRRGVDPRSLRDNLRAFARRTNDRSLEPNSPGSGMYRCDLRTSECEIFGAAAFDFKAAHGVYIDTETDTVYISDTTRHLLRKYSSSGEALGNVVGGFKFPNQILMHDGQLLVANTNHHEIRAVEATTDSFATEINSFDVIPQIARRAKQTWPSHFARVGDQWWVNNMRTGMNEGGIYIFSNDWGFERKVDLPSGADPIALLAFGNEVLVSDWNNDRVHRVSATGDYIGDFISPGLQAVVEESESARFRYQAYAYFGGGAFVAAILLLLLAGLLAGGDRSQRPSR